jgi:hypothetical protein
MSRRKCHIRDCGDMPSIMIEHKNQKVPMCDKHAKEIIFAR